MEDKFNIKAAPPAGGTTCAFLPCDHVAECCLVGGCVRQRFGGPSIQDVPSPASATPARRAS